MSTRTPRTGTRVLAIVPAPRYAASAVLDGWGLDPDGFRVWKLRRLRSIDEKARTLSDLMYRLARSTRPVCVVIGVPIVDDARMLAMRTVVETRFRNFGISVAVRPLRETRRLVLGELHGRSDNALAIAVVRGFFPELARHLRTGLRAGYFHRNGFEAVALAIAHLVETAPRAACALARPEAFHSQPLRAALAAADRRKYPTAALRRVARSAPGDGAVGVENLIH